MEIEIVDADKVSHVYPVGGKYSEIISRLETLPKDRAIIVTPNGEGIDALLRKLNGTLRPRFKVSLRKTSEGKVSISLK